jgi:hypothetical protein
MPSDINRLAVPTLAKGLHVVVKPRNLRRSLLFKEIAILAVPRGPCLRSPLLRAIKASLMFPAVPDRRFGATVPGPRRAIIKSGPTGGRRCPRYGTLLKRWSRVRSSWSRSGPFNGTPRPGVARELPSKKPFQRRGEVNADRWATPRNQMRSCETDFGQSLCKPARVLLLLQASEPLSCASCSMWSGGSGFAAQGSGRALAPAHLLLAGAGAGARRPRYAISYAQKSLVRARAAPPPRNFPGWPLWGPAYGEGRGRALCIVHCAMHA